MRVLVLGLARMKIGEKNINFGENSIQRVVDPERFDFKVTLPAFLTDSCQNDPVSPATLRPNLTGSIGDK